MILGFYRKNKLWDKKDVDFVYPRDDELICSYSTYETFDRPFVGDLVILGERLYKVFKTMVDYDNKEIYIIVEEL
mgnify:CR=1 FL=1|jgi:hypothetical protein